MLQQLGGGKSGLAVELLGAFFEAKPDRELLADLVDERNERIGLVLMLPRGVPDAQSLLGRCFRPGRKPGVSTFVVVLPTRPMIAVGLLRQLPERQRLLDRPPAQGSERAAHDAGLAAAVLAVDADGEGRVHLERHARDLIAGGA